MNEDSHRGRVVAAGLALLVAGSAAVAQERSWIDPGGGSFHSAANWDGPVPDETVSAVFAVNSTYAVSFKGGALSDRLLVRSGDVRFDLHGATYSLFNPFASTPSLVVGESPGTAAACTFTGGIMQALFTEVGQGAASFGALRVTGANAALLSAFHTRVGGQGFGLLEVFSGAHVADLEGAIGLENDAFGLVFVAGAGSQWSSAGTLTVGKQGVGDLFIGGSASVSSGSGIIGQQLDSMGEVEVAGPGSQWSIDGPLDVGLLGAASLLIADGGTVFNTTFATIGTFVDVAFPPAGAGVGEVTVTGAGSSWTVVGNLHVGFVSEGSLMVGDGGTVSSTNGIVRTFLGSGLGSGIAIITGPGSTWSNTGDLEVNDELLVLDGGLVSAVSVVLEEDGVLEGDGTVQGELINRATVRAGPPMPDPPILDPQVGALTVDGNYIQSSQGTLGIHVTRLPPFGNLFASDMLAVTDQANLGGVLEVAFGVGGTPSAGTTFDILTAAAVTGEFDAVVVPPLCCDRLWLVVYTPDSVQLRVTELISGDINADLVVNVLDLIIMLLAWGDCPDPPEECPSDLTGDGTVDHSDLVILLNNFGVRSP